MSFCQKCGKQLPEGVTVCECENGVQAQNVTPEAPATVTPMTAPAPQFVAPMVNNAPVGSFSVTSPVSNGDYEGEYLNAVKDCKIINILSIVLFLVGVVSILFLNEWIAAALFLVGELFALFPNEKLMKLCKVRNPGVDKKTQNKIVKETKKRIKAKNVHFKFSFIIAYVCLACLILSFIVPVPLLKQKQNTNTYVPEETTTEVAEPLCYRPTIDEFMEDFSAMHKVLLVNDVTYRIEPWEDNDRIFSIYVATNGIEYMNIDCTTLVDGSLCTLNSHITNEDVICQIWGSKTYDDATEFVGFAENILVTYVLLSYQNPEEYPCDTEAFGDFVMLMTSAVKNGEGNAMYQHCNREYEHCRISLGYSATNGSYNGSCSLSID